MELNLYVMDIRELENVDLYTQAFSLLDPVRKEKAMRAKNEKDRARLAGAGLLLLLAHVGLPGSMRLTDGNFPCEKGLPVTGPIQAEREFEKNVFESDEDLQMLSPARIIQTIVSEEEKRGHPLSAGIFYDFSNRGRPTWKENAGQEESGRAAGDKTDRTGKEHRPAAYPYFNLSHSGHYAALAAGDIPLGIDIQEPRDVLHKSIGDYRKFSRMESYFKCTGRGIDLKIEACYRELEKAERSGRYVFHHISMPEEYALWVCADIQRGENHQEVIT